MPNHVHVSFTPIGEHNLGTILGPLKSYTSSEINRAFSKNGTLWQAEYFDELIEDQESLERIRLYIEWNPVKSKLCPDPKHWPFSSANEEARKRFEAKLRGV
jgi:REP element-mobilizing transposase RayT